MLAGFQLLIAATGNYGFFNLLTLVLCLLLLDDSVFPARWREWMGAPAAAASWTSWQSWAAAPLAAGRGRHLAPSRSRARSGLQLRWPRPLVALYRALAPFRTFNPYGLFAVMTPTRPEIVIEGSRDGADWTPYEFRWKPGDLRRRPGVRGPAHAAPRLADVVRRAGRLRGQPLVPGLPAAPGSRARRRCWPCSQRNPFPDGPPRYVRSTLYDYHFTDVKTLRRDGTWWRRTPIGSFCPTVTQP